VLGISGWEAIVLIVLILLVLGPERLPEYAENLRDLVKRARRYASGAKEDLRETLGPEIGDLDWRKLDPRQYDPRRIIRDALFEDDAAPGPARAEAGVAEPTVKPVRTPRVRPEFSVASPPPFDPEAT